MNLASRFRQAINHVEALKKELAVYEKKSSSAIVAKEGDYRVSRYALNTDVGAIIRNGNGSLNGENDYGGLVVTPKHIPQDQSPVAISIKSSMNRLAAKNTEQSPSDETIFSSSSLDFDENNESQTPSPVTPDNDEDSPSSARVDTKSSDVAFGELHSEDFFHQNYENTLPATPEKENVDVDGMNENFDNFLSISEKDENQKPRGTDSIDAFEASFQTTFPTSFADSVSPSPVKNFADSDFSDSFFFNASSDDADKNKTPQRVDTPMAISNINVEEIDAPLDEALSLFPNSAFETDVHSFETPEREPQTVVEDKVLSPNRNGKKNSATPRSRLERKQNIEDAPLDEIRSDDEEHSPTLVLKRLQQRKAKQISPAPNSGGKGSLSISEEIKKLDAIANGITSSREKRRSVRQPISYAEPSLNSKLRRGDVFFPKSKEDDDVSNEIAALNNRQANKGISVHTELNGTAS